MRIESDIDVKHLENLLMGMRKMHLNGMSLAEAIAMVKAGDFITKAIAEYRMPRPQGIVSETLGSTVTPIKPKGKK